MTINEFLAICKGKIYLIILLPLIIALSTTVVCYGFLSDYYTSTVDMYILTRNSTTNNNANTNGQVTNNDVTTSQQLSNDVAVLVKSNRVTNSVTEEMGLENLDDYNIKISSAEKNRVITLSVTGNNAKNTAQVVNCIARQTSALAVEVMSVDAVNIIEEAQPSPFPSGPNRPLIIVISLVAGLILAILIILLENVLDITVKTEDDVKSEYDLPVLAHIPLLKKSQLK